MVWTEDAEATMLIPLRGAADHQLTIEARSLSGPARCQIILAGHNLGACAFAAEWSECRLKVPASISPAVHLLEWRCDLPAAERANRQIGETGAQATVDLAVAIAGSRAGDYADLYVEGKRYSIDRECSTCVGVLSLQGHSVLWQQFDTRQEEQVDLFMETIRALPADSALMVAARAEVEMTPILQSTLVDCGAAGDVAMMEGEAYLLIGLRGAPAGTATERVCHEGCVEYLGERWPTQGLAVTRVEVGP